MIGLSLTLDYEIYGNGDGSLQEHVIDPTATFLNICESQGCKSTLFVEVAELLTMKKHSSFQHEIERVEEQLRNAHERGHDIQLHIHPWWFNAKFSNERWYMDYEMSSLCHLEAGVAARYVQVCKDYLSDLFKNCSKSYSCTAYRAGYWSMLPTNNIFDALTRNGIEIDSSVYKWGFLDTELMRYDYSDAHSNIYPWFFDREDVNRPQSSSINGLKCLEMPIYAEYHRGYTFLTKKRISLMSKVKSAMLDNSRSGKSFSLWNIVNTLTHLLKKRAKKLDFCKCSFYEMKGMIQNIATYNCTDEYLPVVSIGHSKDFIYKNEVKRFLELVNSRYSDVIEIVPLTLAAKKYISNQNNKK